MYSGEKNALLVGQDMPRFFVSRDMDKIDYKSSAILLDDIRVPAENLLGSKKGERLKQVLGGVEAHQINIASHSSGIIRSLIDGRSSLGD